MDRKVKEANPERDNYTCQLCGEVERDKKHSVHHKNYDKKDCRPENLITLCAICHNKTSTDREHWKEYFTSTHLISIQPEFYPG